MAPAQSDYPIVHLFDEPQFNTQDGYIGFMLDFFGKLRREGRLVFVCLHPAEPFHLEILEEICERFIFVQNGNLKYAPDLATLMEDGNFRGYLGHLADGAAPGPRKLGSPEDADSGRVCVGQAALSHKLGSPEDALVATCYLRGPAILPVMEVCCVKYQIKVVPGP